MSSGLRPVLLLTVVAGFFSVVAILGWLRVDAIGASGGQSGSTSADIGARPSTTLAARYHLRKRTQRFFDRSKGSSTKRRCQADAAEADECLLAGRYHQRKRTTRFFRRTVG